MKNISLVNITVRNCTYNGVFINGVNNLNITGCDFDENGSSVVPGPRLQHNLLVTHCSGISVKDSRMDTSPYGSGVALSACKDAIISNCEIARNGYYGITISECSAVQVNGNLIEGNDRSGIMAEFLYKGCENITISGNTAWYNNGYGIEAYAVNKITAENNKLEGNGKAKEQEKISAEKYIIME
jgi:parallel beta-helix repeat protein